MVEDNSDFEAICSGAESSFVCNDLPALAAGGTYKNSHAVPGEALPYNSTIVWPIRKMLDDPSDARTLRTVVEDQDILGFLCVDAKTMNALLRARRAARSCHCRHLYALLQPYFLEPEADRG